MEVTAKVYAKTDKGVFFVKSFLPEFGMYINSITVRQSIKEPKDRLWVQLPAIPYRGKFIRPIEFQPGSILKELIEDAALRAVDEFNHDAPQATDDDWVPEAGKEEE